TSSFSCTIFSDMVCCLLSEWCVATSFYQRTANHVSFYLLFILRNLLYLIVRSNGSKELVGRAVMVENVTFPLSYSGFCIRLRNLRTDILNSKYLLYFFRSPYFRKQLEKYSQGSNITNINQVILSQIPIIIPPVEVQLKAIRKVEKMLAAIDKLIKGKQEIISSLERYKKSLIYEVVTGKKEV